MFYLNYNNLDTETQQRLLDNSKKDIELSYGAEFKTYAEEFHLNYETLLYKEANINFYNYHFIFKLFKKPLIFSKAFLWVDILKFNNF